LAQESFAEMVENTSKGEVCVVEKCYVLLGINPQEQCLLFSAMQQLVDVERESNPGRSNRSSFIRQNRHMLLMFMQTKLSLSMDQSKLRLPESELDQIRQPKQTFELNFPLESFDKISLPLPLPNVSGHWGFATLLRCIGCSEVVVLLKLLLLERSVLILGTNTIEVTSCCCALLELLEPYKWASTFMPLLPPDLIDFLHSPVPYITGMAAKDRNHLSDIQNDDRLKECIASDGLSVLNLDYGQLMISDSDLIGETIRTHGSQSGVEIYSARIKELVDRNNSVSDSFRSFFTHGFSTKEQITLNSSRRTIRKHLHSLAGVLHSKPDSWPAYLKYNEYSKAHEFTPTMLLEPLRKTIMHQLKYQEMMAHTQLFVGFVENLKNDSEKRSELLKGAAAAFIVDFLNFKWPRYRNMHLGLDKESWCV